MCVVFHCLKPFFDGGSLNEKDDGFGICNVRYVAYEKEIVCAI